MTTYKHRADVGRYIDIFLRLNEICKKNADGYAEYAPGHSDVTVAAELDCVQTNVATVRRARFGHIRKRAAPNGKGDSVAADIELLKTEHSVLVTYLDDLAEWASQRPKAPYTGRTKFTENEV